MYINTTSHLITINMLDKFKGTSVKIVFVPGVPKDADVNMIEIARKEYPVVQAYFDKGDIRQSGQSEKTIELPKEPGPEVKKIKGDDKTFMIEALQKSGVPEFERMDKRNSEASVKSAYNKLVVGDFETEAN